jgi:hypothetical protein
MIRKADGVARNGCGQEYKLKKVCEVANGM